MTNTEVKKVAVVGSGIAGLTCAYLLSRKYAVTLFEASDRVGGHTATQEFRHQGKSFAVDTGFIVFNDWTYPYFIKLLSQLNVDSQATDMGFSIADSGCGYEYAGSGLNALFAQRRNIFKLSHWRLLRDIVRFNREATADFVAGRLSETESLHLYLQRNGYSQEFKQHYLVPMGAAIWSSSPVEILAFGVFFFVRFFHNHGLLSIKNRPQWRVIKGGSKSYIAPLLNVIKAQQGKVLVNSPVGAIERSEQGVKLSVGGQWLEFDQVVLASHSDQSLALLTDASPVEREILGAIAYRNNQVVLHTDTQLLPRSRRAWASWNYRLRPGAEHIPLLTYNMNILQRLHSDTTFCVTLNDAGLIDPTQVLFRYEYAHPIFSPAALVAQTRWSEINGVNNTWFAGAYWANGFHEDGVVSAIRVAAHMGVAFD